MKTLKKTPKNGLAIFCGNVSKVEGQTDLQLWTLETPLPLKIRIYRCDKDFVLEPLREMLSIKEIFALLVMDRKEATMGILEGKRIETLQKLTSGIPGKVRAGGQSSQRFHRITEGLTKEFYKRIALEMKNLFFEDERLKGILVGGPIPTKDEFLDNEYLPTKLREKVLGRIDLGDTSESGLKELVERAQDILASQEIIREKNLLEKFFNTLGKNPGMAVYDEKGLRKALDYGAIDILLLSKTLDKVVIKELSGIAKEKGTTVEIISIDTSEGEQFNNLGGFGALLRFKI